MQTTQYIKLFSNCIPVIGANRAVFCDLQRGIYVPIPHSMIDMFDNDGLLHIEKFRTTLDEESGLIFDEYMAVLEKQEFIFHCHKAEAKHFPALSMEWDFPGQASHCIIDINNSSNHNYAQLLNTELDEVNCRFVQFRHFEDSGLEFWKGIMDIVNKNEIKSVDLILKDSTSNFTHQEMAKWVYENRKIRCVTLHSSAANKQIQPEDYGFSVVISIMEEITDVKHCGNIHPGYFSINIETFTESQHHNTCLNRKISIDVNGEIKNCPTMAKSYGNIKDTKLIDVVNNPEFQKVWHIKKDQISVCKDCEFRHICTDCRAYLENPEDQYSKPLKCGYNPYTCEWEEWSTNPLKQKAIEFYGMQELVKK